MPWSEERHGDGGMYAQDPNSLDVQVSLTPSFTPINARPSGRIAQMSSSPPASGIFSPPGLPSDTASKDQPMSKLLRKRLGLGTMTLRGVLHDITSEVTNNTRHAPLQLSIGKKRRRVSVNGDKSCESRHEIRAVSMLDNQQSDQARSALRSIPRHSPSHADSNQRSCPFRVDSDSQTMKVSGAAMLYTLDADGRTLVTNCDDLFSDVDSCSLTTEPRTGSPLTFPEPRSIDAPVTDMGNSHLDDSENMNAPRLYEQGGSNDYFPGVLDNGDILRANATLGSTSDAIGRKKTPGPPVSKATGRAQYLFEESPVEPALPEEEEEKEQMLRALAAVEHEYAQTNESDAASNLSLSIPSKSSCAPVYKPASPAAVHDRCSITGFSCSPVLRVCFDLPQALEIGRAACLHQQKVLLELYARVIYSRRSKAAGEQIFKLIDLNNVCTPMTATYKTWSEAKLWDHDAQPFLLATSRSPVVGRFVGIMAEVDSCKMILTVMSVWRADTEDVEHARGIMRSQKDD